MLHHRAQSRLHSVRRVLTLATASALVIAGTGGLAFADNLQDDIVDTGAGVTLEAGSSTGGTAGIRVVANNSDGATTDHQCNWDTGEDPLELQINTPAGVTASPDPLEITECGEPVSVTFRADASAVSGTATVTILSTPAGGGGYNNQVSIPITITRSNTPPVVTVTGVSHDATYQKSATPQPGCSVVDAEDTNESTSPQISNGAYDALGSHTVTCSYTDGGQLSRSASATYTVVRDRDTSAPVIDYILNPATPSGANNWYTGNVSLTWTVTEGQSPETLMKTGCENQSITSDQAATTYSCSATSEGGTSSDSVTLKRDSQAPNAPVASLTPAPNGAGWNNSDVVVHFAGNGDNGPSGVDTCTADVPVNTEGENQVVTGTCTDRAGNEGAATEVLVDLDKTGPTISSTVVVDGDEGTNGWYTSDVTVTFTATDTLSGLGVGEASKSVTSSGEGAAVQVTSPSFTDRAGNTTTTAGAVVKTYKIDKSKPNKPTYTLTPTPNSAGWNNTDVVVDFIPAGDNGPSGIASCTADVTVSTDTSGRTVDGTCTDNAGNISDTITVTIQRDSQKPNSPTYTLTPGPNDNGWHNEDVTIEFEAAGDNGPSGIAACTADVTVNTDGADQTVAGTCTDHAGNTSEPTVVTINRDTQAPDKPTYSIDPIPNGAGWNKTDVTVSFAPDGGDNGPSGIASCSSDVIVDTDTDGQIVTGTCTDNAGNTSDPTVVTIKRDTKAPNNPTYSIDPTPNGAGWNKTDVTVSFAPDGGDNGPSGIASCTADVLVDTDTANRTVEGTCTDNAGNTSDPTVVTIKRDTKAPNNPTYTLTPAPNPAGWNNTDVVIDFVPAGDNGPSGVASCTADVTVDTDGANQTVAGTCTDNAGNTSDPTSVVIMRDTRSPNAPVASLSPAPNDANWNNTDVMVHFEPAGDNGPSGIDTCTADTPVTTEGEDQVVSGTCTDKAGNESAATQVRVDLDKTAPSISEVVTVDGDEGANGWYTSDVTVTFTATDTLSGFGPGGDSKSVTSSGEGAAVQVTSPAFTDRADNTTAPAGAVVKTYKIDKSKPNKPTYTLTPAPNPAGWNNTDVVIDFIPAGDNGASGVASCTADVTVSTDTASRTVEGTCTDNAGNVSDTATVTIKRDTQAPNKPTYTLTPAPNAAGWNNTNVVVEFNEAGDNGASGVASCTADVTVNADGADQAVTGTCTDAAGNVSASTTATVNRDTEFPSVAFDGGPADGESYYFGSVPGAPRCFSSDGLSGIAGTCSVSGYDSTVGTHTVQVEATDKAGNTRTVSRTYHVLAWTGSGFYQPVDMGGVLNKVKGGSTVPLKFELFAGSTELTDIAAIKHFKYGPITCSASAPVDAIEVVTTGGTSLRYDATGGQFVQNWKVPTVTGCYSATMTAQDGTTIWAKFQVVK